MERDNIKERQKEMFYREHQHTLAFCNRSRASGVWNSPQCKELAHYVRAHFGYSEATPDAVVLTAILKGFRKAYRAVSNNGG